ncbi:MAG: FG-GAP repeat domain-containing protein, partial [Limisphaerales bacterium]
GDTLPADGSTRTGRIRASYSFNPWTLGRTSFNGEPCRVIRIDLFRNGQIIRTWTPNTPEATVDFPINESAAGSHYMVRVLGNDAAWMAAYASPIYFDNTQRPRQPHGFTPLVRGRVYDSVSNTPLRATVTCIRAGQTLWSLETDAQGRFRAYVPLDARLIARDAQGRQLSRDILDDEQVYAFCHNLPDNYPDLVGSIAPFQALVREMTWEFPMGYQNAGSYVKQPLAGTGPMNNFRIHSAPGPTPGKGSTEITTLIVDKTRVQPGDTINYAVLFRTPHGGAPTEELSVEWKGWNPEYPRLYTKVGQVFAHNNGGNTLVSLGGGFYLRSGSVVIPSWVGNVNDTSPGIKFAVTSRGRFPEEANLLIPVGPTRSELLISSTWDGFPATWGEFGIGPCHFHRQLTVYTRYNDYRRLQFSFQINGETINVHPLADTARSPDADDAIFDDYFYYDAQLGPQGRNINYRDPIRQQPGEPDFGSVPIFNPNDQNQGGGGGPVVIPPPPAIALPIAPEWLGPNLGHKKAVFWEHVDGYTAATVLSQTNFTYATLLRDGQPAGGGWRAKAVADLNHDGSPDLIWKHASGQTAVWFMNGVNFSSAMLLRNGHALPAGWDVVGAGDLTGNRHSDLILQSSDGRLAAWVMNGANFARAVSLRDGVPVPSAWRFSGVADLDGNGTGDLLWHHSDNSLAAWLMQRGTFAGSARLRTVSPAWRLVAATDFNGDGRPDFLWQNADGRLAIWFMNGPQFINATLLINGNPARNGWRIIGAQ